MRQYSPLRLAPLAAHARLSRPQPGRIGLDDPAIAVMTDLREVPAATIPATEGVERAHAFMIRRGVRLLFVVEDDGTLAGVLTSGHLLGETPMRRMQSHGVSHAELVVGDLMTPAAKLEALALGEVERMRVGHVLATLRKVHRQHVLVADDGGGEIRGIFSASQVARQLGVELQTYEVAQTFADIEAALSRS
jgi:CBS domain-containing protein